MRDTPVSGLPAPRVPEVAGDLEPRRPAAPPRVVLGVEVPRLPQRLPWARLGQDLAVLVAFVVWARLVTGRTGGRDDGALLLGGASIVPALLLLRPRWRAVLPALVLSAAALAVCLLSPFGLSGVQAVAVAAYAGAAFAVGRTYAVTPARRQVLASALCLASLDQFAQGFLAWWGGGDPQAPMIGTFYWHNQYAAFLLPGVIVGAAQAVLGRRTHRLVGWVTAPVCLAGITYSSSRATMLLAVGGLLVVLAVLMVAPNVPGRPSRARRVGAAGALAATCTAALFAFTSSAFFPQTESATSSPIAATTARSAEESVAQNTSYRLQFWRAAVAQFGERPVAGGGFGSFRELSGPHLPPAATRPSSAHNELLHAFAEGGMVWGVPLALAFGLALLAAVRLVVRQLRSHAEELPAVLGCTVALGALLAHAAVDFDWSYPSLAVLSAVLAGLVLAVPGEPSPAPRGLRGVAPAAAATAVVLAAVPLAVLHERTSRAVDESHRLLVAGAAPQEVLRVLQDRAWPADPRTSAAIINAALSDDAGAALRLERGVLEQAADRSERYASAHDGVNARRAVVLYGLGRQQEALDLVRAMAEERAHSRPAGLQAYARLLALSGSERQARDLLAGTVLKRAPEAVENTLLGEQLLVLYEELRQLSPGTLALRCAGTALQDASVAPRRPGGLATLGPDEAPGSCQVFLPAGWS